MNPLLSIWSQPKNTVQYMLDNKQIGYLFFLVILSSFATGVMSFADKGFLVAFSLPVILLLITILSIIISLASWGITSVFYTWIGKMLGGTGTIRKMSYATATALIPSIWTMPIGITAVILYGKNLFMEPTSVFAITNMSTGFYLLHNLVLIGISIFAIVILSKGIGLVHNFSTWRGFGTFMILFGIMMVITIPIIVLVVLILM